MTIRALTTVRTRSLASVAGERRHREPVTMGLPFPDGLLADPKTLRLLAGDGRALPLQLLVLDRWTSGYVRWILLDFQADLALKEPGELRLGIATDEERGAEPDGVLTSVTPNVLRIDTGRARFEIGRRGTWTLSGQAPREGGRVDCAFGVVDAAGREWPVDVGSTEVEETGPLRTVVVVSATAKPPASSEIVRVTFRLHFFAGLPDIRIEATVINPRRAAHPGGIWELGDPGSIHLRRVSFTCGLSEGSVDDAIRCWAEVGAEAITCQAALDLYQDSSGRENWRSKNHVNRTGEVPTRFRGYRLRSDGVERFGNCATPVVSVGGAEQRLSLAVPEFWQNFPMEIAASRSAICLHLFSPQFADTLELQGGEQKTYRFWLAFGADPVSPVPLDWCRVPLLASADTSWYSDSNAVRFLPRSDTLDSRYLTLTRQAIEGDSSFEQKRDVIDEYGWRNYGDIYADHEAVYQPDGTPLVSHYNNQYDAVAGFACHFLMTGDARWWRLMDALARHVVDIDIYHTTEDKSAFNQGLFWHTYHYTDAGGSTHRGYPAAPGVNGGGPSCEHDYSNGLLLYFFLTGSPQAKEAVLGLAQWVEEMDDGRKSVFRWLDWGETGLASASGSPNYHGPGRGAANSIQTLLNAYRLDGDERRLRMAERLIRRCVHPRDDVPALNLLDAERRWYYTVFLETLGRYLCEQAERRETGQMYAYARESLLHYARWMVEHEYPYLDKPEILEYPNETWPAQDMRKCEVFDLASLASNGEERERFRERSRFFFDYSLSTLLAMPTRHLARPVVLMLFHGFAHAWFSQHPNAALSSPADGGVDFGVPLPFVPQKTRALRRAKVLAGVGVLMFLVVLLSALYGW